MIDLQDLITFLKADTGYSAIDLAKSDASNLLRKETLPNISLQYLSITTSEDDVTDSICTSITDTQQYQTITIAVKIFSTLDDFPLVWDKLNKAFLEYTQNNTDSRVSGKFRHESGNALSVQNSVMNWFDKYTINIERIPNAADETP